MSNTKFWKPAYQLFKPEEPLTSPQDLKDFYVTRPDSPIEDLIGTLELEDDPAKFLLAGHRGGGKTTELRRLQQRIQGQLKHEFTAIWVDTANALDRYNIGYAEVIVLIGVEIFRAILTSNWKIQRDLESALIDSLRTVVVEYKQEIEDGLELPEFLKKMGVTLKIGFNRTLTKTQNIRPALTEIVARVNDIIAAAQKSQKKKLVVIVDGLDRHDYVTALEMFSDDLMTSLNCHIIYTVPISLRYSPHFAQPKEIFNECLDLVNVPVFECDENAQPTAKLDRGGRELLGMIIQRRLKRVGANYADLFAPDALDCIAEKSGGVLRDLIRLARSTCQIARKRKLKQVDLSVAEEAVREERKAYTLRDYHYPELEAIHRTGRLTTNTYELPNKGKFVICDELLQNKFILGYYDKNVRNWFDINPMIFEDLERWKTGNQK